MRKNILVLGALLMLWGCSSSEQEVVEECIETPNDDCICTMNYDPVCGCNNVTYSNACQAECVGIDDYTPGECEVKANKN
ncbi:MAG: Kazal-type serine protease inhibitor domain-containing protein [Schleiferiaceae bacterium]|jgi:hypothetical protein|nr:Kazal-type serine protease inhibitor domain-containing protein [Schleiferiaceae bacterium]